MDNNNYFSSASFSEIFKRGFALATSKFVHFFLVLFISIIISYIINNIMIVPNTALMLNLGASGNVGSFIFTTIIAVILSSIIGMVIMGCLVHLMATVVINEDTNIMKSLKFSIGKIGRWFGVLGIIIVVSIAASFGIFILAFVLNIIFQGLTPIILIIIILGIFIIVLPILYMVIPVMIIGNLSVTEAISRAKFLLKKVPYGRAIGVFLLLIIACFSVICLIALIGGLYINISNNIQGAANIIGDAMKTMTSFSILSASLNVIGIIFSIVVTAISVVITTSAMSKTTDDKENIINRIRVNLGFPSRNPVNTDTTHNEKS